MKLDHFKNKKFKHFSVDSLPSSGNFICNQYNTITNAYSLRKLYSTSTRAIRVRRSSDNAEMDVVFAENILDIQSMLNWSGSDSVFIKTWYDQMGTNDLSQTTNAQQPRIVNAGTLDTQDGFPVVVFDGSDDNMIFGSDIDADGHGISFVYKPTSTIGTATTAQTLISGSNGTISFFFFLGSATGGLTNERQSILTVQGGTTYGYGQTSSDISGKQINQIYSDGTGAIYGIVNNNVSQTLATVSTGGWNSTRSPKVVRYIGQTNTSTNRFNGNIQEIIIEANSDGSGNISGIASNINEYYGIY
jgi:hypothetical protein